MVQKRVYENCGLFTFYRHIPFKSHYHDRFGNLWLSTTYHRKVQWRASESVRLGGVSQGGFPRYDLRYLSVHEWPIELTGMGNQPRDASLCKSGFTGTI